MKNILKALLPIALKLLPAVLRLRKGPAVPKIKKR